LNITMQFVGGRIRELRQKHGGKGISQESLAEVLKVTPNTVSRWETATYEPKLEDLEQLARFFGRSILEFFPTEELTPRNERLSVLMRAAKDLPDNDIDELQKYAEFRRARHLMDGAKKRSK
jgi:transcriptional regulator with XRE-family HTH domain